MTLDPASLDPDPIAQLAAWLADAEADHLLLPQAFALATADGDGMPSVRFVLLRGPGAYASSWPSSAIPSERAPGR
jgi:pyridoxine/pyridoxamine 5'-phosphate oxidase